MRRKWYSAFTLFQTTSHSISSWCVALTPMLSAKILSRDTMDLIEGRKADIIRLDNITEIQGSIS